MTDDLLHQPLSFGEKVDLAAHIERRVKKFEVHHCLFEDEVYRDIEQQIKREFGLKDVFELPFEHLYNAHEFIDGYELPLALSKKIEAKNSPIKVTVIKGVKLYG